MKPRRLGNLALARILEREAPEFEPTTLIPAATPAALAPYRAWLEPKALDPATGRIILPVQSYVVRTGRHNILLDSCIGEGKTDLDYAPWHRLRGLRFLADLAAMGLAPDDIDYVFCTHLHGDHVGWNTRLANGRWVPTFPRARYVLARREVEATQAKATAEPNGYYGSMFNESVLPVIAAGQAQLVDNDFGLDDEAWIEPLPGHTVGHYGVRLRSQGAEAIMIGDLMHSPVQCAEPDWESASDADPALGRATRRRFLDSHADTDRLVLTAHFPSPSVGHIRRHGNAYRFHDAA